MERAVEVAVLDRGKLETIHLLSPRRERLAARAAGIAGAGFVLAGMSVAMAWIGLDGQVVHAPTFFGCWAFVAGLVGGVCARVARRHVSRYRIGSDIDADAFAPHDLDLVRRSGSAYELGLVRGMFGVLEGGRAPVPIEAITGRGSTWVPLPAEGMVRVEMHGATFVIGRPVDEPMTLTAFVRKVWAVGRLRASRFVRVATLGVAAAGVASAVMAVPAAIPLSALELQNLPFLEGTITPARLVVAAEPVAEAASGGQHPAMNTTVIDFDEAPQGAAEAQESAR